MDDILFGNNNQATINRLAKRSYRANKQRNVFVTIALFLTAFMITSVFSLGCSYFETYQMQQIRAMGTTADVAITSLSEEQYEELSRSSLVSVVGVSQRLGSIDTSGMDDALLSITWIDETEWQEHRVPTISDIHGDYPQAKNEIMLPTWALRAMGISFLLLATLGTAIYIPIYSAFRRMVPYAAFHYPVISLLVVAAIVLLVCLATPVITFMQNVKQSVVERLRQN